MSKTDKRKPRKKGFLDKVAYEKVGIELSNVVAISSVKRLEHLKHFQYAMWSQFDVSTLPSENCLPNFTLKLLYKKYNGYIKCVYFCKEIVQTSLSYHDMQYLIG